VGEGVLENIYLSESCICGASFDAVFYSSMGFPLSNPLGLSRNSLKLLTPNISLGEEESSFVIRFDEGFMLVTSHLVDSFPLEKIKRMVDETLEGCSPVINAAPIIDAMKYILPVLSGEKMQRINFINMPDRKKLAINTTSLVNGKSTYEFDSEFSEKFIFTMDADNLKKLDFSYKMCYNPTYKDRMLFKNENSTIVIMGMR